MYDKILVAIDHSEISDRVLAAARDLALLSKGEVWVLHLREDEVPLKTGMTLTDESMDQARASVAAAAGMVARADLDKPWQASLLEARPRKRLCAYHSALTLPAPW